MTDWVSVYIRNKKNSLYQYVTIISKIISADNRKILNSKRRSSEIFEKIINIYVDKYFLKTKNKLNNLSKLFIDSKYIDDYELNNEISATTEYFIKNNMAFEIEENQKDIILIAVFIKMAVNIDNLVNPFVKEKLNINNIILQYLDYYHKIEFIFLIDQGKKNTKELIELVKLNVRKEKSFFDLLTSKNSFNKYIRISEEENYYIAQYNYYIEELEKYDIKPIKNVYETRGIDDSFALLSLDLVNITLMKEYSVKKALSYFFLPIKKSFFTKEKNIRELKMILKSKIVSKQIKLLINYNEITSELSGMLNRNKFDYYIYCSKDSTINEIDPNQKYLYSKEFIKRYQMEKADNVILETINVYMEDNDILSLKS